MVSSETGKLKARWISSAFGPFLMLADQGRLVATGWRCLGASVPEEADEDPCLNEALAQRIQKALCGSPQQFLDLPAPQGTAFQKACWARARQIPAGETLSYGKLAEAIGSSGGGRAAGQAMRKNPLPIIIPCHRIISSNGALGGFSGTSAEGRPAMLIKAQLLQREQEWRTGIAADLVGFPMEPPIRSSSAYTGEFAPPPPLITGIRSLDPCD
jgi:methylated-DNA-[protein]-cysteine S-methyltransferase